MNRFLILTNFVLLAVVLCLYGLMSSAERTNRKLSRELADALAVASAAAAAQEATNNPHELCLAQAGQLALSLSNAQAELAANAARLLELEARLPAPAALAALAPPSPAAPAARTAVSPATAVGQRFDALYGTNQQVLGRNLEFSGVYGRRVVFKDAESSQRIAFDVDELHPAMLAELGINAEVQKAIRLRQEQAWKRADAAALAAAAAAAQKREEERAARAEAERQRAEQEPAPAGYDPSAAGQAYPPPGDLPMLPEPAAPGFQPYPPPGPLPPPGYGRQ